VRVTVPGAPVTATSQVVSRVPVVPVRVSHSVVRVVVISAPVAHVLERVEPTGVVTAHVVPRAEVMVAPVAHVVPWVVVTGALVPHVVPRVSVTVVRTGAALTSTVLRVYAAEFNTAAEAAPRVVESSLTMLMNPGEVPSPWSLVYPVGVGMTTPGLVWTAARMNTDAPVRSVGVSDAGQVMVAEVAFAVARDTAGVVVACPRIRIAWTCAAFVNVGIVQAPS
jgi:hypothetical protein